MTKFYKHTIISRFECIKIDTLDEVDYSDVDVIAMDEAQFFTGLKKFVEKVLESNKTIILSGFRW